MYESGGFMAGNYRYKRNSGAIYRGFTMIEILLVIAILGILLAIVIPAYNSYINKAYNASAISYIQFIKTAESNYWTGTQLFTAAPAGDGPGPTGIVPGTTVPAGVGYIVGVFPVLGVDATTGYNTGTDYIAFTGHISGSNVYSVDSSGKTQVREKSATAANAAADAKSEDITQAVPAGWGRDL